MMLNTEDKDLAAWKAWKAYKSPMDRDKLFQRFESLITAQVNKWSGPVPRQALYNKAKVLAAGAFNSFDPSRGVKLSTHVTNALQPLSRLVYTHQNTVRLPENLAQRVGAYNTAVDRLSVIHGQEPSTVELHTELGWPVNEINRIKNYIRKDLVESVGGLNESFYSNTEDAEMDSLQAIWIDLTPEDRKLFEYSTGFNGVRKLSNPEIMQQMGLTQAQLSYKKSLLNKKIGKLL